MRRDFWLALSVLLSACGGDNGAGPEPPANLTGELAYLGDGLVINNYTTGETRQIQLYTAGLGPVEGLSWEPNGRSIVYGVFNQNRGWYELHRVPVSGSPVTVLFPNEGHQSAPAFLPDGRLSYWVNGVEVAGELHGYEIFVDGQPFSPPLHASFWPSRAAWAPDGASVVIVRLAEGGVGQLIRVSLATGKETIILAPSGNQSVERLYNPVYSHAGDRLAFTRILFGPETETDEIWIVNADGSDPHRIVTGHSNDRATWSPDDTWSAFDCPTGICIVSAGGGPVATLVRGYGTADWR